MRTQNRSRATCTTDLSLDVAQPMNHVAKQFARLNSYYKNSWRNIQTINRWTYSKFQLKLVKKQQQWFHSCLAVCFFFLFVLWMFQAIYSFCSLITGWLRKFCSLITRWLRSIFLHQLKRIYFWHIFCVHSLWRGRCFYFSVYQLSSADSLQT